MSEDKRSFPVSLVAYKVEPDKHGTLWTEAHLGLPNLLDLAFFRMAHGLNNEPTARARAEFTLHITDEQTGEVRPLEWWSKGSKTKDFQLLAVVKKEHSRTDDVDSLLHLDAECLNLEVAIIRENPLFDAIDTIEQQLGAVPTRLGDALNTVRHANGSDLDALFSSLKLDWTDWDTHEGAKAHLFGYLGGLANDALEAWTELWAIEERLKVATPA